MLVEMQQGTMATPITPSNSSPVSLTANAPVKPSASGYAIQSYTSKTPSDTTPPSVASGDIVKMGGAGYLYQHDQTETTLWTNSDPTANFEQGDITLSQAYTNFKKIRIYYVPRTNILTPEVYTEYLVSDIVSYWRLGNETLGGGNAKPQGAFSSMYGSALYTRYVAKDENNTSTKLRFWRAYKVSDGSTSQALCIPTKITGLMV